MQRLAMPAFQPSQRDKMRAGEPYDSSDPQLVADRQRARTLCQALNTLPPDDIVGLARTVAALFGAPLVGPGAITAEITPPFFCDYGHHITLGDKAYFNFNCVILDVAPVHIGARALFGPGVHIYTALHPLSVAERRGGLESGRPVVVEDDVWVGGGAILCPGVRIGAGTVIGAGSVVTRSVPAGVFAAGNPCRVLRTL